MKALFAAFVAVFLLAAPVQASEDVNSADLHTMEANALGYWHCTAYPEGHGHTHGYSYYDVHYSHAYWGAMQRCEQATHHHCHDVHCHYDHH